MTSVRIFVALLIRGGYALSDTDERWLIVNFLLNSESSEMKFHVYARKWTQIDHDVIINAAW